MLLVPTVIGDNLPKETQAPQRMTIQQLGRYEIISELGRGAMGVVYKAMDPLIERTLAVKCVGIGMSQEESDAFERRFYREAKSAGRLNHPNIVTIHDVGKSGDHAYIAMEFLEGQSLREILDSGVVPPLDLVVDVTAQVADGLAFAHQNDIVHRDIKPANIMVLYNGTVKITDFGIALIPTGSRTLSGSIFGSPKYIPPEQVVGESVDGRSDIFSLGAVLYEMLTGVPPFTGDDLNQILSKVINEMPPAPSTRNNKIPPAFDYIIEKSLAKLPGDRYQTVQEMAADLRNYRKLERPALLSSPATSTRTLERRKSRRAKDEPETQGVTTVFGPSKTGTVKSPAEQERRVHRPSQGEETVRIDDLAANDPLLSKGADRRERAGLPRSKLILFGVPILVLVALASWTAVYKFSAPAQKTSGKITSSTMDSPQPETPTDSLKPPDPSPAASVPPSADTPAQSKQPEAPTVATKQASPAKEEARATAPSPGSPDITPPAKARGSIPATPLKAKKSPIDAKSASATVPSSGEKPKAAAKAKIAIAVTPWGEIYVDGKSEGVSPPLRELNLSAGKHIIEIRNTSFPSYTQHVDLAPNSSVKVKHKFE